MRHAMKGVNLVISAGTRARGYPDYGVTTRGEGIHRVSPLTAKRKWASSSRFILSEGWCFIYLITIYFNTFIGQLIIIFTWFCFIPIFWPQMYSSTRIYNQGRKWVERERERERERVVRPSRAVEFSVEQNEHLTWKKILCAHQSLDSWDN